MTDSYRHTRTVLACGIAVCSLSTLALAQQPRSPRMPAPPPMRFVSRDERAQLTSARDSKARVKTTLELAQGHLTQAEAFTSQKRADSASEEIGRYLGLVDDARQFIGSLNREKGSTRDLYRYFEISLRAHIPRLAVMRRDTPADYAGHIRAAEDHVKNTRSEALDSFYGHSVLREDVSNEKKSDKPKDSPEGSKRP